MQIPRRGPRRKALLFLALFLCVTFVVVGTFGAAAGSLTPRNSTDDKRNKELGEINGSNPANDCWSHHKGEGMRDVFIVYPIVPKQLKIGEPYEIPVQIVNPWKQEVRKMQLDVTLLGEKPVLTVEAAAASVAAHNDLYYQNHTTVGDPNTGQQSPGGPTTATFAIKVPAGATGISAFLEIKPHGGLSAVQKDEYNVTFLSPGSKFGPAFQPADETTLSRHFAAELKFPGTYNVTINHKTGFASTTDVYLNATIVMGSSSGGGERTYSIKIPADTTIPKNAAPYTAIVKVIPFAAGTQAMVFHVRAEVYYEHQLKSTPNEDFYNRYQNLSQDTDFITGSSIIPERAVTVGATFVPSEFGAVSASAVEDQWQFVLAETSGFGAAALLLPSLLLGGTYGKASRRLFNTILGGAKRRVMFHNLSSLGLSLVAFLHIILFVYEIRYTILMGVMWGGLGALSLLVLGLTGYYQVPLIQRHGYKWWRYTHLAFGLLVIVFVSYHMIADGPDFFFIKEQLPKWINDVNLAQK